MEVIKKLDKKLYRESKRFHSEYDFYINTSLMIFVTIRFLYNYNAKTNPCQCLDKAVKRRGNTLKRRDKMLQRRTK